MVKATRLKARRALAEPSKLSFPKRDPLLNFVIVVLRPAKKMNVIWHDKI
jgi:hypothetical protein